MTKYRIITDGTIWRVQRRWSWFILSGWAECWTEKGLIDNAQVKNFYSIESAEKYINEHFGKDKKRIRKWRIV